MTYRRLIYLKFQKGWTTQELMKKFPHVIERVSEVALADLPMNVLEKVVTEKTVLDRIITLKIMRSNRAGRIISRKKFPFF